MKRLLLRLLHGKPKPEPVYDHARAWGPTPKKNLRERVQHHREAFTLDAEDLVLPDWADDPQALLQD